MANTKYYYGLGRRKEATASVRLRVGKGLVSVNDKTAIEHFGHQYLIERLQQPLIALGKENDYDITVRVTGGGKSGQADAARLGIAKALVVISEDFRTTLKKPGYLKRDGRVKERKKYGLKRARKAPQFTKR